MASSNGDHGPGGFLVPTLPSPPRSSHDSVIGASHNVLPPTRTKPLSPGSSKESAFIDYVDNKLLGISRRYEKRFNVTSGDETMEAVDPGGRGYEAFGEFAKDVEAVVDVVWTSGTRKSFETLDVT